MNNVKQIFVKEKSAFDTPELKNQKIEKLIKEATSGSNYSVQPMHISQIEQSGNCNINCAVIITQLLRIFDELGSHPNPVYKALIIILTLLRNGNKQFIQVCRALVPEIQSVLYLSFGEKRALFRDQIHLIASAIYDFLMYEVPLPDPNSFNFGATRGNQIHRPAPPPEVNDPAPVIFMEETPVEKPKKTAPPPPPPPVEDDDDDDDMDLPFDPRAMRQIQQPPPPVDFLIPTSPPPPVHDFVRFEQPPQSPPPAKPAPIQEPEIVITPKTEKDLMEIKTLSLVLKTTYDDSIEFC